MKHQVDFSPCKKFWANQIKINTTIHQCLKSNPYSYRIKPFYAKIVKYFKNRLDPLHLCPDSITFWFFIPPYTAIGISVLGLNKISIYLRQQVEPNETIYLFFKMFDLRPPIPLTILTLFISIGFVITDAFYRVIEVFDENNELIREHIRWLNPFNLTSRMSVFFPVYDNHTSIGFLTIDFRHIEISLRQSLEPNDNIYSLIRFLDIYSVFPLQVASMFLAIGLFLTGIICRRDRIK